MRVYLKVAKQSFTRKAAYKLEYYLGLFGALLSIFISVAIWKAVYGSSGTIADVSQQQAVTYAALAMLLRTALTMNEFHIDSKIKSGEIVTELIRPYSFLAYLFSLVIGEVGFNMWSKVLPLIVMSLLVLHLDVSDSWLDLALFIISVLLSYTLLYFFNLIFWLLAFWVHQTWSIVTIKNAIILLLSGATIPFWFLPHRLVSVLEWLPFKSIYFGPLSVILGKVDLGRIWMVYIEQIMWITVLAIISLWLWRKAQFKLVIQGG